MTDEKNTKKRWLPLEANPDVISKYCVALGGPKSIELHDVYSVDLLDMVPPTTIALLFLFPSDTISCPRTKESDPKAPSSMWFTQQTIGNACGTVGLLHALANCEHGEELEKTSFLSRFLQKTEDMNYIERGQALELDTELEKAHSKAETEGQSSVPSSSDSVAPHFVTLVPKEGSVWLLNGAEGNEGPVFCCPIDEGKSFLETSVYYLKEKFMDPHPTENRFNIISVVKPQK